MPPAEDELLSDFLLAPASLPSIISLQKFTDLFPRPQRSNPQIKHLYRDLRGRRALDIEHVKRNIAREVKRGEKQKRHIIKARRKGVYEESEPKQRRAKSAKTEHPQNPLQTPAPKRQHTLSSILPEMEQACADLEAEIAASEAEIEAIKEDMESTIGGLSDLRYGRFSKPIGSDSELRDEVLEGLERLDGLCDASKGSG